MEKQRDTILYVSKPYEPKFTAFGLSPQGVTEEGMYDVMVEDFNAAPLAGNSIVTDELLEKINASYNGCQNLIKCAELQQHM